MTDGLRRDLELRYAPKDEPGLALDLYRPAGTDAPLPVLVYLHGGGWVRGDKADHATARAEVLARAGFAVASVNYRLSDVAPFPAQLHDAKGAVRWLRANAGSLGLDATRIGSWGPSAGGYLAAMLGLTAGDAALEGTTGGNLDQPSTVQAVVDWYGPSDLLAVGGRNRLEALVLGPSFEARLLGLESLDGDEAAEAARRASPRFHVSGSAPPFLLMHGDRDRMVSVLESTVLHEALVAHGVESTLVLLGGAGHDDRLFDEPVALEMVTGFFRRHLC